MQFEFSQDSNRVRPLGNSGMAKRKFRIVKRENNIPVLGVCEYCNAEFAVDRKRLSNTPVRQAGAVLKCLDAHKNRVISAQATYPCGSSAVGG